MHPLLHGEVAIYVDGLPKEIVADGHSFVVGLTLVNGLGRDFAIPGACNGWLEVGLASSTISYQPFNGAVACSSLLIRPGTTRISRTVITTYEGCSEDTTHVGPPFPPCVGPSHNQAPVLPAGVYHLVIETSPIPHARVVSSTEVRLLPRPR